jgi:hypothetical protein
MFDNFSLEKKQNLRDGTLWSPILVAPRYFSEKHQQFYAGDKI